MLSRNGVLEQKQSQEYRDNQCIINDYYKTSKEREAYKNFRSLEIDLCNTIKKYEDNVRSYLNLKYLLHKENDNKTSFLSRLKELSLWIDNHKDDEYISDNISLVLSLLDELSQLTTTIRVNELKVAKHNRQKNEIMTVIKSYLMDLEAVAKLKQDLEKQLKIC